MNVVDGEEDGWLVAPDDEEDLVAAMVAAVADPAERMRRGANAGRHARESHSWDSAAARLSDLYDACANTSNLASSR